MITFSAFRFYHFIDDVSGSSFVLLENLMLMKVENQVKGCGYCQCVMMSNYA